MESRLYALTHKFFDFEFHDFFRYVPSSLNRDDFDSLLILHNLNSWIPLYCKFNSIEPSFFRDKLWIYYQNFSSLKN
jgi:hypothetical protein